MDANHRLQPAPSATVGAPSLLSAGLSFNNGFVNAAANRPMPTQTAMTSVAGTNSVQTHVGDKPGLKKQEQATIPAEKGNTREPISELKSATASLKDTSGMGGLVAPNGSTSESFSTTFVAQTSVEPTDKVMQSSGREMVNSVLPQVLDAEHVAQANISMATLVLTQTKTSVPVAEKTVSVSPTDRTEVQSEKTQAIATPADRAPLVTAQPAAGTKRPILAEVPNVRQSSAEIVERGHFKPRQRPVANSNPVQLVPVTPHSSLSPKSKALSLRRGKWTVEEEAYVARVIQDFNSGYLNAPAGTTLRTYLSDKLHCDPMRITKKFTGEACIGKRVFHPAVRCPSSAAAIDRAQAELDALERRWRRRLEMQQRESAKKAAASAAAAAASTATGRGHYNGSIGIIPAQVNRQEHMKQSVARTASWLDRANAILSNPQVASAPAQTLPPKVLEHELQEVERLIHEGPIIQQTTAGLPQLLDRKPSAAASPKTGTSETSPPAEKRAKFSGAEDAEALVGFVNSVRASAAAAAVTGYPGVK